MCVGLSRRMELAPFDWTLYWFMFPVAICVATTAMLSGIGGAAFFVPIILIGFPILGPEYPFQNMAASIGVALLTVTFGFSSGFIGYFYKRLIDFKAAIPFILVGVPISLLGALSLAFLKDYEDILRGTYAVLMLILASVLLRAHGRSVEVSKSFAESPGDQSQKQPFHTIVGRDGAQYRYRAPRQGKGAIVTALGSFLTGLLGVGIGEVVMPQLAKRNKVPIPVAAATSIFIAITVVAVASITQVSTLIAEGGFAAMPWNAVVYTIPGVIIGGQIGPRLQGKIPSRIVELAIGGVFTVIGIAMGYIALRNVFFD